MKHKGAYSNGKHRGGSDNWASPQSLWKNLNREFSFTIDAAASVENTLVVERFWTEEDDALQQDWTKESNVYCNPPYSEIPSFLVHAHKPEVAAFLVPSRFQALWWMKLVLMNPHLHEIRHLLRNPRFRAPEGAELVQPGNRSPTACCVLVYRREPRKGEIRQTLICADTALTLHVINRGSFSGRPTTYNAETLDQVIDLSERKSLKPKEIAERLNVPLRQVYRIVERLT